VLCDVKSYVRCVTGEIVRFSPTSEIDGGGAQHIRPGQPSPIRLVIWVELGPKPRYVVGSRGPGPEGPSARGYSEPGRIPLRTLTSGTRAWFDLRVSRCNR